MPDIFFDTLDQVPAELRDHAKEVEGGKVAINVVPKVKLDEFRENNIQVSKERDTFRAAATKAVDILGTDDFDTAAATLQELRTVHQRVKDGQLVENEGLEEALAKRTNQMRQSYEDQIRGEAKEKNAWREKAGTLDQQLRRGAVERAIHAVVLDAESGANPQALRDITARAFDVFHVTDDGKLIARSGDATIYGEDGVSPMTPAEWLKKLRNDTPYFFKQSNGGGAGQGGGSVKLQGMTEAEFQKLTPEQRLRVANGEKLR